MTHTVSQNATYCFTFQQSNVCILYYLPVQRVYTESIASTGLYSIVVSSTDKERLCLCLVLNLYWAQNFTMITFHCKKTPLVL